MSNYSMLQQSLMELKKNKEQYEAVNCKTHCAVLAGPGSGKTKTLTTAIARVLHEEIIAPRGIACITYNNECVIELETRLSKLGVLVKDQNFIGTVHSFALTQIIIPYTRCIVGIVPDDFKVASIFECRAAVENAYKIIYNDSGDPHSQWAFAKQKRNRDVDRSLPSWNEQNSELAKFIEAYELELRKNGLIDFDDMPLIAFKMIKENLWIRQALEARFPILFVDEYQDLGHTLHELVQLLCFGGKIRLFAVGDADQSIYGFTGANPELLKSLTERDDVETIQLKFNYRSGTKIIRASSGALNEVRDYQSPDGTPEGEIIFNPVNGGLENQANFIVDNLLVELNSKGYKNDQIAILYKAAWIGNKLVDVLDRKKLAYHRTDTNSLIKKSSKLACFIENCAIWVTDGWKYADPPFRKILKQALNIVYGNNWSQNEERDLTLQLIKFLQISVSLKESTNTWLTRLNNELITPWISISRNNFQEWDICKDIIGKTTSDRDMSLNLFAGKIEGSGRLILTTFHSSKGREFDVVIIFGVNNNIIPDKRDRENLKTMQEARRLFYVAVTRPKKILQLVYQSKNHSEFLNEYYRVSQQ